MTAETSNAIVTPEAVVLEFETAGIGSRTIARLLDLLVMAAALSALQTVASFVAVASLTVAVVLSLLFFFAVFVGYPIAMEAMWDGRTLGKAALGLRVVTRDGAPTRPRHAVIRGIIGLAEVFLLPFVAVLAALTSRANQRVGDLAAGTIVVRQRVADTRAVAVSFPPPLGLEPYVGSLDVGSLTGDQYAVVRSFLMRVLQLSPDARSSLAVRIANPVAERLRHTPPAGLSAELFLVCVASAYQLRHGGPAAAYAGASGSTGGWGGPGGYGSTGGYGSAGGYGSTGGYGAPGGFGAPGGYGAPGGPGTPAGWGAPGSTGAASPYP